MDQTADEQMVAMTDPIASMEGVGDATAAVFTEAGFRVIGDLKRSCTHEHIVAAVARLRRGSKFDDVYWARMTTRCDRVLWRAKGAMASEVVPHEYMCPIGLDWFQDPVVTPAGFSYSREELERYIDLNDDPVYDPQNQAVRLVKANLYPNISLRQVVEHFRMNHHKYGIMC